MEQKFRYYLRVRYSECDQQRVVSNTRYGDYIAVAFTEFVRAIGLRDDFESGRFGVQWVKQTVEWHSPARFDQVLEVTVATTKVGTTSFTIATEIRDAGVEHRLIATAETVLVLIDLRTMSKTNLTERHRTALQDGAPGTVMDHAGFLQR